MDTSEIIQAFIEKPTYDSSNQILSKATPELLEAVEKCLQLNRDKRLMGMQKQTMKKIDIHDYLKKQGFDVSYSTVKRVTQYLETKHQEAFIRQEYMPIPTSIDTLSWMLCFAPESIILTHGLAIPYATK